MHASRPADSGVDIKHPELVGTVKAGQSFINGEGRSGLDAITDENGHGTAMAGVIASLRNGKGIAGMMYGGVSGIARWEAQSLRGSIDTTASVVCPSW